MITELQTDIINSRNSKSEKIRRLHSTGLSTRLIALHLNISYQHAYNVIRIRTSRPNLNKIGIEIEFSNKNYISRENIKNALNEAGISTTVESYNHATRSYWKLVTDATCGYELVSPPLDIPEALRQLEIVCGVLKRMNVKVNKKCGLHIHFDARSFSFNTWQNLAINYSVIEDQIDLMMPLSRRGVNAGNGYCRSIFTYTSQYMSCNDLRSLANCCSSRFHKLNFCSFVRHGTVEFRHHSGTIEFHKIKGWINILKDLIEFSKTNRLNYNSDFTTALSEPSKEYFNSRVRSLQVA